MSDQRAEGHPHPHPTSPIEVITDPNRFNEVEPHITIRTGLTQGNYFVVKINQPAGRAIFIAVHL
jgi:hypothetical protein